MDQDCYIEPLRKQVSYEDADEARMATLAIWGLDSPNCATRVRNSSLRLEGVVSADVDFARPEWGNCLAFAFVDYVPAKMDVHALVRAVAEAGEDGRQNPKGWPEGHYRAAIIR